MLILSVKLETDYRVFDLDEEDYEQLTKELLNLDFVENVSYGYHYVVTCALDGSTDIECLNHLQQVKLILENLFTKYYNY
jgi:hypothetical protein